MTDEIYKLAKMSLWISISAFALALLSIGGILLFGLNYLYIPALIAAVIALIMLYLAPHFYFIAVKYASLFKILNVERRSEKSTAELSAETGIKEDAVEKILAFGLKKGLIRTDGSDTE